MSLFSHPIKKLTLAAVFGIGYTLGAKAGRERYEQIKNTAQQVKDDPRVQDAAAKAEGVVRDAAQQVKEDPRVQDVVQRAESLIGDAADAVKDDDLVDKAKDVASDAKDKAQDVAADVKHKADDVASDVKDAADDGTLADKAKDLASDVKDKADEAATKAKHVADDAKDAAKDKADDAAQIADDNTPTNDEKIDALLDDQHVVSEERLAYSTGPDIEESIDDLAPNGDKDRI
ncbi:hypothetical protein IFT73_04260 [Aeromicrobium sp. CFBP 8757]|uniref:hypothetical protein n=1 Tax=Aeromicrobium sp. CFBP 8757 TaxID=2775288 RepID=UPI00177C2A41|nr:hypothetical protein [Aeromicrobium sp. CFBP 8757]MBD8606058.1 hypothetical protein [Aeromicrobium sp. CFBP 8757]